MKVVEANEILQQLGPLWMQLAEYRMTHGYAHVLLKDSQFARVADVYLSDCDYIAGMTSGGPCTCFLSDLLIDGEACVEFRAGDALVLRALRANVVLQKGRSATDGSPER